MTRVVFLNGRYINYSKAKFSIEDRGFQFADGVYEVIAYINNDFIDLNFHLYRLKKSLNFIDIRYNFKFSYFKKIFYKLIKLNKMNKGLIYLQITRGAQKRNHVYKDNLKPTIVIYIIKKEFNDNIKKIKTKTAITYPDIRWKRRDIKTVSLLANVMAAKEANKKKSYEAILIENGYVTEGTSSNIWVIKNNTLITHPANTDILKGVTREAIKKLIYKNNLKFIEKRIKKSFLYNCDEVFLTSSSSFITPLIKIDNKKINNGKIGKLTLELAKLYILNLK